MENNQIDVSYFKSKYPLLNKITKREPVFWKNPHLKQMKDVPELPITVEDMKEAEALWHRFAPFFEKAFPETKDTKGIIESPIRETNSINGKLNDMYSKTIEGRYYLKCDNELPIAGSIKARGGVYEVLYYAEELAINAQMINKDDNYEAFYSEKRSEERRVGKERRARWGTYN